MRWRQDALELFKGCQIRIETIIRPFAVTRLMLGFFPAAIVGLGTFDSSQTIWWNPFYFTWFVVTFVMAATWKVQLESLILAQNERWRHA